MIQRVVLRAPRAPLDPAFLTITADAGGHTWATWAMPGDFVLEGDQVVYVVDDAELTPAQWALVQRSLGCT